MNGEVIGVNTAIISPTGTNAGIGFAIPANIAKNVIAQLKEKGAVTRGWLGVNIQPVSEDIAQGLGLGKAEGALVADVTGDSPAAQTAARCAALPGSAVAFSGSGSPPPDGLSGVCAQLQEYGLPAG